jgi:thymidylate synthase (FAD)
MNGSLRSWITYCAVRCGIETQKEHRDIAKECAILLFKDFPFLKEVMGDVLLDNYSAEE